MSNTLSVNFEIATRQRFTTMATFRGTLVAVKKVNKKSVELSKEVLMELKQVSRYQFLQTKTLVDLKRRSYLLVGKVKKYFLRLSIFLKLLWLVSFVLLVFH